MTRHLKYMLPGAVLCALGIAYVVADKPETSPEQDAAQVLAYWTAERMQQAQLATGGPTNPVNEVITPGGDHFGFVALDKPEDDAKSRKAGILFYVSGDDVPQHCSATVLASERGNLLLTAAHCVVEKNLEWKRNLMFVPAYTGRGDEQQRAPLERWPIRQAFIPQNDAQATIDTDIAIASTYDHQGRSLQETVGGASHPFITQARSVTMPDSEMRSYPGAAYSGGEMRRCLSRIEPTTIDTGILTPNCTTMSGSSGSGFRFFDSDEVDHVIGVVHGTGQLARLQSNTFDAIYELAQKPRD